MKKGLAKMGGPVQFAQVEQQATARTIWKFLIPIGDRVMVKMPKRALLLDAQMQGGDLILWAVVESDAKDEIRHFAVVGTGHPMPNEIGCSDHYIATVQDGPLVWHLFEFFGA